MAVRQQTMNAVRKVFTRYPDKMMTIQEIADHAQVNYGTAKRALYEIGARFVPGAWPQRWTMREVEGTMLPVKVQVVKADSLPRVGSENKFDSVDVVVSTEADIAAKWNKVRDNVLTNLAKIDIQPSSNVDELVDVFNRAATVFASIALTLSEASTSPDWYGKVFSEVVDSELAPL